MKKEIIVDGVKYVEKEDQEESKEESTESGNYPTGEYSTFDDIVTNNFNQ